MIHPHLWPAVLGACVGLPLLGVAFVALARHWPKLSQTRRWVLLACLGLFEIAYWANVYAWLIEPNRLVVHPVTIESANWHGAPIKIAAISDIHIGSPHVDALRVERLVRRVNALKPDLVVLLGDYVGAHQTAESRPWRDREEISNGLAALALLDAPLGVVAVIGNHDSWYDRATVTQALQADGIAALWNRNVVIQRGRDQFVLAGIEDDDTGRPDYAAAIDGAPEGLDVIVLSHSPDPFVRMPSSIAVMLAGHTHCGQVYVPLLGRPIIPSHFGQRFACGLIEEEGKQMFVTGGIGTSSIPVRFLTPPEIALITLRGAN